VLVFVPVIFAMMFFITFLEGSGYMARRLSSWTAPCIPSACTANRSSLCCWFRL
jgi:hypothetical protein